MLYWRNPTDPKIRPDPTFFFLTKKKRQKKQPTDYFLILRDGAPRKNEKLIQTGSTKQRIWRLQTTCCRLALKMLIWGFETWLVA